MKKNKKILAILAVMVLVLTQSGLVSPARAESLTNVYDRLSDSEMSQPATHNVSMLTHTQLDADDYIEVDLATEFGNIIDASKVACSGGLLPSRPTAETARCTVPGATTLAAESTVTITIADVPNPGVYGSYVINVHSNRASTALVEKSDIRVAIIDDVNVSATVLPTLDFVISPVASGTDINGYSTTDASATTSIAYGDLTVGFSHVIGQQLQVTTNADYGYTVTVEQNQNLTSNAGSDIDSFINSTASTTAQAWVAPANLLDQENTYGHMGLTTDDADLFENQFADNTWKGLNGTTTMPVMYHTGPADGTTQDKGLAKVAYRIQISPLQEAGDYYNVLTYIATPTY